MSGRDKRKKYIRKKTKQKCKSADRKMTNAGTKKYKLKENHH